MEQGEGHLEVMLHRRCMINDRRGVGQALDDVHQSFFNIPPFHFHSQSHLHRKTSDSFPLFVV